VDDADLEGIEEEEDGEGGEDAEEPKQDTTEDSSNGKQVYICLAFLCGSGCAYGCGVRSLSGRERRLCSRSLGWENRLAVESLDNS
jgi:hypothetical protein